MNAILQTLGQYVHAIAGDPLYLLLVLLIVLILILSIFVFRLSQRLNRLMRGTHARSLEGVIKELTEDIQKMKTWQKTANELFTELDNRVADSIRGTSLIRFNPFKGTGEGGNQSFSTAFLNEEGDGVVLSSLYSRERVSLFGKPLSKFNSSFELTDEEKQAVKKAKDAL